MSGSYRALMESKDGHIPVKLQYNAMRNILFPILAILFLIGWSSCRKDFAYGPSSGNLEFSRDTLFLDTVFSNIGSSTYTLKVYNRTRDDMEIPSIRLGRGSASAYRLNVDGRAGKEFEDVPLLAEDSLFIFVEVTSDIPDSERSQYLYTDAILFDAMDFQQQVALVTLIQDAQFLYADSDTGRDARSFDLGTDYNGNEIVVDGFYLDGDALHFRADKPYVIYGYAAVGEGTELVIDPGARVHFHQDSGLIIEEGASLQILGATSVDSVAMEGEVIFEGDRLEPSYGDISGQWGSLWLRPNSGPNLIDHLTLRNATIGLVVQGKAGSTNPTLRLRNSRIYNSSAINLWSRTGTIVAENLVLGSAGITSLYCNLGGDYRFLHSTIANYWNQGFRANSAVEIDNFSPVVGRMQSADLRRAEFLNCIIEGNRERELSLRSNGTNDFSVFLSHCLLRFQETANNTSDDSLYDFDDPSVFTGLIVNGPPDFRNPAKNDYRLGPASAALDTGDPGLASGLPTDIVGHDRTEAPDMGAYEYLPSVEMP